MKAESFVELLRAFGEADPPEMPFGEGEEIRDWQARFREKVDALRGPLPERVDPLTPVEVHAAVSGRLFPGNRVKRKGRERRSNSSEDVWTWGR